MRALVAICFAFAWAPELLLLPAVRCADVADPMHCRTATPKQWAAAERRSVHAALVRLGDHELVRGILVGLNANGYRGLNRYATDVQSNAAGEYLAKFGPGFVLYTPKVIGITDAFFELADIRDSRSGYRLGDAVLLHELIHAYDDRRRSTAREFTALTGWTLVDGRWQYNHRVDLSAYNGVYAETLTLYARGHYAEAWTRDRAFATGLAVPVPRLQSLASPAESFADMLAHLILDPSARDYLDPEVVSWFERHVFPSLRTAV